MDAGKYVVLDVETNGLSSLRDDLLSISIFKPDDGKIYDRFLPLELNREINSSASKINGITKKMLIGKTPLTQSEVDMVLEVFELRTRTILIYSNFDKFFIKNYFKRKKLKGFEEMTFYNIKQDIISSRFSFGNVTKDNLCQLFNIEVKKVHSSKNDCILEWKLFEKLNGRKLLITDDTVFELNENYIIPASFTFSHPNLKYYLKDLPPLYASREEIKRFPIDGEHIQKFPTNFNGVIVENLINCQLQAKEIYSKPILLENKKKLKMLGRLPQVCMPVELTFNFDGTVDSQNESDKFLVKALNLFIQDLKNGIDPLIDYIKQNIFCGKEILSQELIMHPKENMLAKCDLSSVDAILEIKTVQVNPENLNRMKYQLYYESNGRECYLLETDWNNDNGLVFIISKVRFSTEKPKKEIKRKIKNIGFAVPSRNAYDEKNDHEKSYGIEVQHSVLNPSEKPSADIPDCIKNETTTDVLVVADNLCEASKNVSVESGDFAESKTPISINEDAPIPGKIKDTSESVESVAVCEIEDKVKENEISQNGDINHSDNSRGVSIENSINEASKQDFGNESEIQFTKNSCATEHSREYILYADRIFVMSNQKIKVCGIFGSEVAVQFTVCGNKWNSNTEVLLKDPYCPKCRKMFYKNLYWKQ